MERFLTTAELADRWKVPPRTLSQFRYLGRGPAYLKIGNAVRYRASVIEEYERQQQVGAA